METAVNSKTPATVGQFHTAISILLNKGNSSEDIGRINREDLQDLIDDPNRLYSEFVMFINSGGMPASSHFIQCEEPRSYRNEYWYTHKIIEIAKFIPAPNFYWDPAKIELIRLGDLTERYMDGKCFNESGKLSGYKWVEHLVNSNVQLVNENVFDYLMNHKYLIPSTWKKESILSLGTLFRKVSYDEVLVKLFEIGVHCCFDEIDLSDHIFGGRGPLRDAKVAVFVS